MFAVLCLAGCASSPPETTVTTAPSAPSITSALSTVNPPAAAMRLSASEPRLVQVGASVNGTPIALYLFGDESRSSSNGTLVIAAIHGDEPPALLVGRRLIEFLREHPDAAKGKPVAVMPVANPDGVAMRSRTNAHGVDRNRNFPASNWKMTRTGRTYTGLAPASEPETRAVMAAVERVRPARIVSIHSPLRCNNYDGPGAVAAALAGVMAEHNGYPVTPSVGYSTPGSFGSWAGADRGIPVVTLELPPPYVTPERAWQENREALLAVIRQ